MIAAMVVLAIAMAPAAYFVFALLSATWTVVEPLEWGPYRSFLHRRRAVNSMIFYPLFWYLVVWSVMVGICYLLIMGGS